MTSLSEVAFEFRKDVLLYLFEDSLERIHDSPARDIGRVWPLTERYLANEIGLHVQFSIVKPWKGTDLKPRYYCALFGFNVGERLFRKNSDAVTIEDFKKAHRRDSIYRMDDSVLINVANFMKPPEGMILVGAPSRVRLKVLDACLDCCVQPGEHLGTALEVLFARTEDGKLRMVADTPGVTQEIQLANEMVQSTASVVSEVPDGDSEISGWFYDISQAYREFSRLAVVIMPDSVGVTRLESEESLIQCFQVFFRPIEFLFRAFERDSHDC